MLTARLSLTLSSAPENAGLICTLMRTFCEHAGLSPPPEAARVELALAEAVNNAIQHTYQGKTGTEITIQTQIEAGYLRIEVHDQAQSLDLTHEAAMPNPCQESGRGWPLMRTCVDRVDYRIDNAGNVLTLSKYLSVPKNLIKNHENNS
ncbi:serine/threonine-protein kinase RsbW [Gammaproteobacteria bacterium]